jgi:Tfp pilus assembly PilM family ATPase
MSHDVCAVDFTTNTIQMLVRRRNGSAVATDAALPSEAIEDGKILQPVAVQLYLNRLMKDLKPRSPELRVTVSDSACVTRFLEYPKMSARDLERSLRFEAARELPMNPRDAYLGWQVVDEQQNQQTVLLVAAWRDVVEGYLEALEGLGSVRVIEPRSLALARGAGLPDAILLDWTGERVQVAVVEKGRVTYTSTVLIHNGTASSVPRVVHVVSGILPKATGRRSPLPTRLVLLGKFSGSNDVKDELAQQAGMGRFEFIPDWHPPEPFARVAESSQVANIGMLLRDRDG